MGNCWISVFHFRRKIWEIAGFQYFILEGKCQERDQCIRIRGLECGKEKIKNWTGGDAVYRKAVLSRFIH